MRRLSIRWRLTLWYGIVLSAVLAGFSIAVYALMRHHLLALTDAALAEELADLSGDVVRCDGPKAFPRDLGLRYASHDGYEFQVSTRQGEVLFHSDGLRPQGLPIPGPEALAASPAYCQPHARPPGTCSPGVEDRHRSRAGRSSYRPPSRSPPTIGRCGSCGRPSSWPGRW